MGNQSRSLGSAALWVELDEGGGAFATLKGQSSGYEINVAPAQRLARDVAEGLANPGVGLSSVSGVADGVGYTVFRNLLVLDEVTTDRAEAVLREIVEARAFKQLSFDVEDEVDRERISMACANDPVKVKLTTRGDGAALGTLAFMDTEYALRFFTADGLAAAVNEALASDGYFLGSNVIVLSEISPKAATAAVTDFVRSDMLTWLAPPPDHYYGDDIELLPGPHSSKRTKG